MGEESGSSSHPPHGRPRQVSFSDKLPSGFTMTRVGGGGGTGTATSNTSSLSGSDTDATSTRQDRDTAGAASGSNSAGARSSTAPPSTPPARRARFQRSPYVSHVRAPSMDTDSDADIFAVKPRRSGDSAYDDDSDYDSPGAGRYGGALTPPRAHGRDVHWSVPRSPGPSPGGVDVDVNVEEGSGYASASDGAACPSPSPRPTPLPRLDFSQASTPLTARKAFTPRAPPPNFDLTFATPSRPRLALGRKISLNNLGAYDASITSSAGSVGSMGSTSGVSLGGAFDEEVLAELDGSPTADTSFGSYTSRVSHITLDTEFDEFEQHRSFKVEQSFDDASFVTAASGPDDQHPRDTTDLDEDADTDTDMDHEADDSSSGRLGHRHDEADVALGLAALSIPDRAEAAETSVPVPMTPRRNGVVDLSTPPNEEEGDELFHDPELFTPRRNYPLPPHAALALTPDMPSSPASVDASFSDALSDALSPQRSSTLAADSPSLRDVVSPSRSNPPLTVPSVPATPGGEGYGSDRSDWMPAPPTTGRRRRVVVSDDSDGDNEQDEADAEELLDSPPPRRAVAGGLGGGLRGRTPAAIVLLNAMSDPEDRDEDANLAMAAQKNLDYTIDDSREYSEEETLGSLKEFIVDSDAESEEEGSADEQADEGEESDASFEGDLDSFRYHQNEADSDEEEPQDAVEILETTPEVSPGRKATESKSKDASVIEVLDSDSEDEEPPYEPDLHFSPAGRPTSLPNFVDLTLGSRETTNPVPESKHAVRAPAPPKKRAQKAATGSMSKREWELYRERFAQEFFDELDASVFHGRLGSTGVKAGLAWSARLSTSAGNATRKTTRQGGVTTSTSYTVNLSTKVLTTTEQIESTLAHEMCHLACWVISNELKNPHGAIFKSWGARVMKVRPDVPVTTKHSYEIQYKYSWKCTAEGCGKVYNRHSKSIDTAKQVCGSCRGKLAPLFASREATGFQAFLKDNMKAAKEALPGASHGDVMRALSARWSAAREGDHTVHWASVASEGSSRSPSYS